MLAEIDWNAGTIAVAGGLSVALAATVGGFWYRLEKDKSTNELKQRMVERGMSAAEIERVIAATDVKEEEE